MAGRMCKARSYSDCRPDCPSRRRELRPGGSNFRGIQEVALTQLLDETLELLGGKFREQNITVRKRYDVEGLIYAAPTELRQVFTNLMVNALAATPAGGRIALHVFASHDWRRLERRGIHVVIADSGVGIPHDYQKRIFAPFFTTKGEKGTGLGLYVIRRDGVGWLGCEAIQVVLCGLHGSWPEHC
jgi:signal transduction histidine kinase